MNPTELRAARKALGLTQAGMAKALRLSPGNGDRTVRLWETDGNTVPGPVQVAVEFMLAEASRAPARPRPAKAMVLQVPSLRRRVDG